MLPALLVQAVAAVQRTSALRCRCAACPGLAPRSFVIKKAEQRYAELTKMGIAVRLIVVGRKGATYFKRRPQYNVEANFEVGQSPTIKEAQAIADDIFADFVSQASGWEPCFFLFLFPFLG
jgi:hypothetical protein